MQSRYLSCLFLVLLMVVPLSGIPYEQTEEYAQKQAILNERAARFKAETGFNGNLEYDLKGMKFKRYSGRFASIQFPAFQDSILYMRTFEEVLVRILPYISANRQQLVKKYLTMNNWANWIEYRQIVNGYSIESGGRLSIVYTHSLKRVSILDETYDIPPIPRGEIIPEDEAYNIAWDHYVRSKNFDEKAPRVKRKISILYRNRIQDGKQQPLRLCWKVVFPKVLYYIDAYTSEFYTEGYVINKNQSASAKTVEFKRP